MSTLQQQVEAAIHESTGNPFTWGSRQQSGGGCIAESSIIADKSGRRYFLKLMPLAKAVVLQGEAFNLRAIAATGTIRVPQVIAEGKTSQQAFLVLDALDMVNRGNESLLGKQLAALHRNTSKRFGWPEDNVIGATHQPNGWKDSWIDFLREHRLGYQLQLARQGGLPVAGASKLLDNLDSFYTNYKPIPSLLHGDLWAGNAAYLSDGSPVTFDPACYYGDRETDLAMTEMFGGFGREFYKSYDEAWPIDSGYKIRKRLYNLYHELNHFNLFGGGYGSQASATVDWLLRAL